jgi:signal transduction histidine kinase
MHRPSNQSGLNVSNVHLLFGYIADLELEVDRLRKQGSYLQQETHGAIKRIAALCAEGAGGTVTTPVLAQIDQTIRDLAALRDIYDPPGYHPAHDQVVAVAVRPLVEQVFRWQQRILGVSEVVLRVELECEYMEWFAVRLRHILDNLISNGLRFHDPDKEEAWVRVQLRASRDQYQLQVSDNGLGLPADARAGMFELLSRAAPIRAAGFGVGLPVAKLLVEQSGGELSVESAEGEGSTFVVVLPRYELEDFLV